MRGGMDELSDSVAVMVGVAVDGPYTYRVPEGMQVQRGSIVVVPLGPRPTLGVVWGKPKDSFAHNRLKDIAHVFDAPPLSDEILKLVDWVARYTLAAPGMVLRGVLRSVEALEPAKPITAYRLTGDEPARMTDARMRVLETMTDGMAWAKTALVGASGVSPSVIDGLVKSGALEAVTLPRAASGRAARSRPCAPNPQCGAGGGSLPVAAGGRGQVRRGAAGWGDRGGQDGSLLRSGCRSPARRAAGADPSARDRLDAHLSRPVRRNASGRGRRNGIRT